MKNVSRENEGQSKYAAGFPPPRGLYDPRNEHDSCGTGLLCRLDGRPDHDLVEKTMRTLVNLEHRGAVGGDKSTGDGAGLLLQMPDAFMRREATKLGMELPPPSEYGVAMVFLPTEAETRKRCEETLVRVTREKGLEVLGWRDVPINASELGEISRSSMPAIRQFFIGRFAIRASLLERKLYVVRRLAEKEIESWTDVDAGQFYISSLSSRTIIYKGMLTGTQLSTFYPDLDDGDFTSSFSLFHQRYSTNTFPTWSLAQPFRYLAHNGEINTLRGNINQMRAREAILDSYLLGDDLRRISPVIDERGSDSSIFDNVLELLVASGRSIPHAMMMMVPEAWGSKFLMGEDKRAFYEYHANMMEPWDGPASIVFTDGHRYIGGVLDRNGLRPSRYTLTRDGLLVLASETGVLEVPAENILRFGRLQPGKTFLVDLHQHRIVPDSEIKSKITRQQPYRHWIMNNAIELRGLQGPSEAPDFDPLELLQRQHAFGYTDEELKMVLRPMAFRGQEAVGSMGNDAALAVLSDRPQLLFNYFKQLFAQVTNPPIDPLREELVMSLLNFVGRERNLLSETPEHCRRLKINHPVMTPEDIERIKRSDNPDIKACEIDVLFPAQGDGEALAAALDGVFEAAEKAIDDEATILILTDRNLNSKQAAIPILLATAGLHHHLIRRGKRTQVGIVADTCEAREVMHFALLIGYGAAAVCPHLAMTTIRHLAEEDLFQEKIRPEIALDRYITAVKKGLLKTFSRMGISTIRSYRGAQIFEAIGLSRKLIDRYFTNTASRVEGIGLEEIAAETNARHRKAYPERGATPALLDSGGAYSVRDGGENHMWTTETISKLQHAVRSDDYGAFKEYSRLCDEISTRNATLRGLFRFRETEPVPIEEVEPIENITKRFVTAAMSLGSISPEAHEAIAIALNRIGGRSNSGEGGEDPARFVPLPNGDSKNSAIKQIASGRFGVTIEYLLNAKELQIKMAQGAKPGEGGQLPGHKVDELIARVRHTTPGVTLISPPPHHDIYSIEDLAQLIYDLKCANPKANVSVKLVSEAGVGTVAAGVAKAKADLVLISGHDGGTGASPLTSIKHVGLPWELGLAETQQTLINNRLRDIITVQTDGQLKTGRDVAIAALLGAEEFGFGTSVLICLGCIMMRKCHLNTCPVGVATQNPTLRGRFPGKPEYVVRFLQFIASELREQMARLGFRTVDEMVGRVELLEMDGAVDHWKARGLDFSAIFTGPEVGDDTPRRRMRKQEHETEKNFDRKLIELAAAALERKEPVEISLPARNVHRTIGAMLSGEVVKRHGSKGLPEDTIRINLAGSGGQSLGAFLAPGVTIRLEGDANDYLGKGLSGGKIILAPPKGATFRPHENIIGGNVCLYGATEGEVYINGMVGERFAIRNSGALAVVEGVGDHGCEYMTGGVVVILGQTGYNFAAGMSGGVAYVYDPTELFETRCNLGMVDLESVWTEEDERQLRSAVEAHYRYTSSAGAQGILKDWDTHFPRFVKVMPVEYRKVLERMRLAEHRETQTVSASEEVYRG